MAGAPPAERGPAWLKGFFPGYFALVMGTGIVAVAARMLRYPAMSWALFSVATAAYPILWLVLLARLVRFPRAVLADFASHERGPTFLTIVAANGVLGSQFAIFGVFAGAIQPLFWFSLALWLGLVYGFLATVTARLAKPDLAHGLNGAWLLIVVATESMSILGSLVAERSGAPPPMVFAALAFYFLGAMLYVLLSALIFFRWVFRPMHPAEMGAPWWINMGAVAIATLAGSKLMALHDLDPALVPLLRFVSPFTVLLWVTSTFWFPLLILLFLWKEMQRGPHGYDPGLWSAVFPLGMYAAATQDYAAAAHLPFLAPVPEVVFWAALVTWALTFIGLCVQILHPRPAGSPRAQLGPRELASLGMRRLRGYREVLFGAHRDA